jgi:dihydroxy-acid dehydratase
LESPPLRDRPEGLEIVLNGSSILRIGVPFLEPSSHPDAVEAAGGRAVPLRLLPDLPPGVALAREWVCDAAQISLPDDLDALLLADDEPKVLAGLLNCALRLDLPAAVVPGDTAFHAALMAAGLAPRSEDPAETVVRVARYGGPRTVDLLDNFSLANALRAGVAAGGGPELLVHLCAIAREAQVAGFSQMLRVLAPETPVAPRSWAEDHGAIGVLAHLGDTLHDVATVAGTLKEGLPEAPPAPEPAGRLVFIRGRNSGTEAICKVPAGMTEVAGECRVFRSEEKAVRAVKDGEVGLGTMIVVPGCGARGGPGALRLDHLAAALEENGAAREAVVLTDGVAPEAEGVWISAFYPEAVAGGIIGRFADGDELRIDFVEGRIRTGEKVEEILARRFPGPVAVERGYAARYARSALPALEGGGFG